VKQVIAIGCIVWSVLVLFHLNLSFNSRSVRTIAVPASPGGSERMGMSRWHDSHTRVEIPPGRLLRSLGCCLAPWHGSNQGQGKPIDQYGGSTPKTRREY
jgi:hypothetical protein